jgi:predicted dehydrogenase
LTPANPIRVAVVGIGGFASCHHEALLGLEQEGEIEVVATCDPRKDDMGDICARYLFDERGVKVFEDYTAMLDDCVGGIDLVIIASPSQLHAEMHAECVKRHLDCYLEKPPTLDPVELEEMVVRDTSLSHKTNVGFHFVHQRGRQQLRHRIQSGEFGHLREASLLALAARPADYYRRNNWAGKLLVGNAVLLDSCAGNALSHNIGSILFLLGAGMPGGEWARPDRMKAELYRAYDIETMDTVFASVLLQGGGEVRMVLSHSCPEEYFIRERLEFDRAVVEIFDATRFVISHRTGEIEEVEIPFDSLEENLRRHLAYLKGVESGPAISLEDCRGFVELNALLYIAAEQITRVAPTDIVATQKKHFQSEILGVRNLGEAVEAFRSGKGFPSDTGFSWARPGGSAGVADLGHLRLSIKRHRKALAEI